MKVLHVYKTFINDTVGGTEQVIAQLGSNSKMTGIEHTVLSLSKQFSGMIQGVNGIKNLRYHEDLTVASNSMSLRLLWDFRRIAQAYDLIHYHFPWPFADMLHLLARVKKPSVVTYHSDVIRQKLWFRLYEPLMHCFLRSAHVIVATSPQYLASSPVLQRYRDKTSVVPIGINRDHYPLPSAECVAHWRERYGAGFFIFVGMMRYYKGLSVLLNALVGTNYPMLIVGLGPMEAALKQQAQRLKLKHVYFVGYVSEVDKMALISLALGFVFPSTMRAEAFGVSLLEAAMMSKPLITTDIGTGSSYVNIPEETGLIVPPNDAKALREAMNYLWTHPERAQQMGEAAATRHQVLFTGEQMKAGYEAIYRRLVPCMGDTLSAKNDKNNSNLQHISGSCYDSTAKFKMMDKDS